MSGTGTTAAHPVFPVPIVRYQRSRDRGCQRPAALPCMPWCRQHPGLPARPMWVLRVTQQLCAAVLHTPVCRRYREINAHLLLDGQPRVVKVFHTFEGSLMVPPIPGDAEQQPRSMQASLAGGCCMPLCALALISARIGGTLLGGPGHVSLVALASTSCHAAAFLPLPGHRRPTHAQGLPAGAAR